MEQEFHTHRNRKTRSFTLASGIFWKKETPSYRLFITRSEKHSLTKRYLSLNFPLHLRSLFALDILQSLLANGEAYAFVLSLLLFSLFRSGQARRVQEVEKRRKKGLGKGLSLARKEEVEQRSVLGVEYQRQCLFLAD